jgi:hypothetical protein
MATLSSPRISSSSRAITARNPEKMPSLEERPTRGRVVIATTDPHALATVQQFLRFQITEHTGDPTAIHSGGPVLPREQPEA